MRKIEDEEVDDSPMLLVCNMEEPSSDNIWYLDTGCSNHMCGKKELFLELDDNVNNVAKFGDDRNIAVKGKEKSLIHARNGDHIIIFDAFMCLG